MFLQRCVVEQENSNACRGCARMTNLLPTFDNNKQVADYTHTDLNVITVKNTNS